MKSKSMFHICIQSVENGFVAVVKSMPSDINEVGAVFGDHDRMRAILEDARGKKYLAATLGEMFETITKLDLTGEGAAAVERQMATGFRKEP